MEAINGIQFLTVISLLVNCHSASATYSIRNLTDTLSADEYFLLAEDYFQKRDISKAIINYELAASKYKEGPHLNMIVPIMNKLAGCFMRVSKTGEAMYYLQRALTDNKLLNRDDSLEYASTFNVMAGIYRKLGLIDLALEKLRVSLSIKEKYVSDEDLGPLYANFGTLFLRKFEMEKAIEYYMLTYESFKAFPPSHPHSLFILYRNLGTAYLHLKKNNLAIQYYKKAIAVGEKYMDKEHSLIADVYGDIGYSYWQIGAHKTALEYGNRAVEMFDRWEEVDLEKLSRVQTNLGMVYDDLRQFSHARTYYRLAVSSARKGLGEKNQRVSSALQLLARSYYDEGEYDSALFYLQRSLIAGSLTFMNPDPEKNPSIATCFENGKTIFDTLILKALVLIKLDSSQGGFKNLIFALDTFKSADTLVYLNRSKSSHIRDRHNLGEESLKLYQNAVDLCYNLYKSTGESEFLNLMFHFNERSKGGALKLRIQSNKVLQEMFVPENLRLIEDSLRANINFVQSTLKGEEDSITNPVGFRELVRHRRLLQDHMDSYQQSSPVLSKTLNKDQSIEIRELAQVLDDKTAVIEYFLSTNNIYTFIISSEEVEVIAQPYSDSFRETLANFRASTNPHQSRSLDLNEFVQYAHELFIIILRDQLQVLSRQSSGINRIILIPDHEIGYVPFELLVANSTHRNKNHSFILEEYALSYGFSATTLVDLMRKKARYFEEDYIGFAPSEKESDGVRMTTSKWSGVPVPGLTWNREEVVTAAEIFNGTSKLTEKATESSFKRTANNHRIIHLATHAIVDNEDPMNSKLLFSPSDSLDDGFLHAYELYNMNLNSDLAVLSACNTGYGKLTKGEGIMSLGMGFAFAGVPSIVMSHWNANDRTTADLMKLFYQYLAKGYEKDVALRQAKLDFLATATDDIAHPYYWGGFVIMGDTSPIKLQNHSKDWVTIGVILLTVAVLLTLFTPHYSNSRH